MQAQVCFESEIQALLEHGKGPATQKIAKWGQHHHDMGACLRGFMNLAHLSSLALPRMQSFLARADMKVPKTAIYISLKQLYYVIQLVRIYSYSLKP